MLEFKQNIMRKSQLGPEMSKFKRRMEDSETFQCKLESKPTKCCLARRLFEKLTDDRHGHEDTEINNVANARAAAEAKASPGTSPTTATATTGIHFDHLGARMLAMAQCGSHFFRAFF